MKKYEPLVGMVTVLVLTAWSGVILASDPAPLNQMIWNACMEPHIQIRAGGPEELDPDCPTYLIGSINPGQEGESSLVTPALSSTFQSKPGWPILVLDQFAVSLALAEVGDSRGLATIFHENDGTVHALAPDAQPVWNGRITVPPFGISTTPAIADLDEDGLQETLIGVRALHTFSATGGTFRGWPVDFSPEENFGTPTPIAVRFAPMEPVVVVKASVSGIGRIHVMDAHGNPLPGWPVTLPSAAFFTNARIAVGDVTGDGIADVVAVDLSNGRLFVYDHQGQLLAPFPISTGGRSFLSAPTLGDLDGDGAAEIVFRRGFRMNVIRGDGTPLPGWPQEMATGGNFGVALGDVDGDGDLEVTGATVNFVNNSGAVYLWNGDGTLLPGWPKFVNGVSFAAPTIIADVDGDGQGDVLASGLTSFLSGGAIYAWKSTGELIPGFPIILNGGPIMFSAPTVADIDRDGMADLGVVTEVGGPFNSFIHWFDLGVPYRPEGMEWPAQGHDMARTGAYSPPVTRRSAQVRLRPSVMQSGAPMVPLTAVVTLPAGSGLVPSTIRLVEVDGVPVSGVKGFRLGGPLVKGTFTADKVIFQFDGPTVRDLLTGPGVHRLLFHSDILGDGVMYEAEAELTLN